MTTISPMEFLETLWNQGEIDEDIVITGFSRSRVRLVTVETASNGKFKLMKRDDERDPTTTHTYYLPPPEDAIRYLEVSRKLAPEGPGFYFPGCVAAMEWSEDFKGVAWINTLQCNYKFSTSSRDDRKVFSKYSGARHRLIEHVFVTAAEAGREKVHIYDANDARNDNLQVFAEVAQRLGYAPYGTECPKWNFRGIEAMLVPAEALIA